MLIKIRMFTLLAYEENIQIRGFWTIFTQFFCTELISRKMMKKKVDKRKLTKVSKLQKTATFFEKPLRQLK